MGGGYLACAATESENQVKHRARRDVEIFDDLVVRPVPCRSASVLYSFIRHLHLPSSEDQPLLRRWDTRLLLNLLLDARDLVYGRPTHIYTNISTRRSTSQIDAYLVLRVDIELDLPSSCGSRLEKAHSSQSLEDHRTSLPVRV